MEVLLEEAAAGSLRAVEARAGETLLDALRRAGAPVEAPCGGQGTCGKCAVDVLRAGGWERVLACQEPVADGLRVRTVQAAGQLLVEDDAPGAEGMLGRFARDEARPGELGMAVDLGTTTIAGYLFDLETGALLARGGQANPQAPFGADVISRIRACGSGQLGALQQVAAGCIRDLGARLAARAGVDSARIGRWAVAGNTVMQHILCGLSPESIGAYPFAPQTLFGDARAVEGLDECVELCPCVSGYVGGDITAGILAAGIDADVALDGAAPAGGARTVLFADLGTNGEMALASGGELLCCATATGPAFEGANISQGMQAREGAISACRFEDGAFSIEVVGGAAPVGICGSGLIDALAACLEAGLVDETGRLLPPDELPAERAHLVELRDGKPVALLTPDGAVALTQKDVRALQLAKAAVAAGIATLLEAAGADAAQVDEFCIAGAFGAHMRPEAAAAIGLFPAALLPKVRMAGNCAGAGACAALLSTQARERMAALGRDARYIELSLDEGFSEAYVDAMEFEGAAS
ncbi:MAG TPA: DUF4445 domain-containing protein [Candidatus Aphodovivens avistercoris]|nr:DUF4445 domain-containing protein [Candidatus Aphodovivens avistercoris]